MFLQISNTLIKSKQSEDDYFFSKMIQKDSLKIKEVGVLSPFTINFKLHALKMTNQFPFYVMKAIIFLQT